MGKREQKNNPENLVIGCDVGLGGWRLAIGDNNP